MEALTYYVDSQIFSHYIHIYVAIFIYISLAIVEPSVVINVVIINSRNLCWIHVI